MELKMKNGFALYNALKWASILVVPIIFPLVFDFLVRQQIMLVPQAINQRIFWNLTILFFIVDVPVFALLGIFRGRRLYFILFGALFPLLFLILTALLSPVMSESDQLLANSVFHFCVWYVIGFGALDGLLLFKILNWKFEKESLRMKSEK